MTLDYYGVPDVLTGSFEVEGGGRSQSQREIRRCFAAGFEDGGRGPKPRNWGNFQKLEKSRKRVSPSSLCKESNPAGTLVLAQW